ncbi:MAG: IS66 family transposase zinc-finger binding domain-containing protein [Myxococcaceae bacterium]|nr:IS66 family transposase zinc-finger binding domain-containing protein [Myxococcaceae bacterium]
MLVLQERLNRNSGNSSRPPSSDSPDQRAERRGKGPTGGKRGGQPGHPGSKRDLLPKEQFNEFKPLFPSECSNCFSPLPATPDAVQRYQTIDLPVLKAHVIEWLRHRVACPKCRHKTWASMAAIPETPFGPRVEAVIGLVTGVYHLSRRVAVSVMSDILGIDISLCAVSAVEERVSEATKPPVDEAWEKTEEAATKHTDGSAASCWGPRPCRIRPAATRCGRHVRGRRLAGGSPLAAASSRLFQRRPLRPSAAT